MLTGCVVIKSLAKTVQFFFSGLQFILRNKVPVILFSSLSIIFLSRTSYKKPGRGVILSLQSDRKRQCKQSSEEWEPKWARLLWW